MKKRAKSTVNILLSMVLVAGLLPVNAYATDTNQVATGSDAITSSTENASSAEAASSGSAKVAASSSDTAASSGDTAAKTVESVNTARGTLTSDDWYQCGTCEWIIESGVLTIRPLEGETEGMLENWSSTAPWASDADGKDHRGNIQYVVVEEGVYASTCYNMFAGCKMLKSVNLSNLNTSNVTDMSSMFEGCTSLTTLKLSDLSIRYVSNTKSMFKGCSKLAYLDLSNLDTSRLSSKSNMFNGCSSLAMIVLKAGADFSDTKLRDTSWQDSQDTTYDSSSAMLEHNAGLTSGTETYTDGTLRVSSSAWAQAGTCQWMIDSSGKLMVKPLLGTEIGVLPDWTLSGSASPWANNSTVKTALFNGNVYAVTCNSLFAGCSNLASVSLSNLYTVGVSDMSNMYMGCSALSIAKMIFTTALDLTLVSTTDNMFNGCTSLASVDLSGWETNQITSKKDMFTNCSSLHMITLGEQADWSNSGLWNISWKDSAGNSYATTTDMLTHNTSMDNYAETYVDGAASVTSGWTQAGTCQWIIDSDGQLLVEPLCGLAIGVLPRWYGGSSAHAPWYYQNNKIKSATFADVKAQTCYELFDGCSNMTRVYLSGLDTSAVTDMERMFYGCSSLAGVNLYLLNSSLVSSMAYMLSGCSKLYEANLADPGSYVIALDTANVTDMSYMFEGCGSASSWNFNLDLSRQDTSRVSNVYKMFSGCSRVETIDLTGFSFSNVTDMRFLFENCSRLTTIKGLSDFDTSAVTTLGGTFSGCSSLTTLDLSAWDTANVTDIDGLFAGCSKLTSFNLADIYTSKVTNINALFMNCTSLESLDLSCLDPASLPSMDGMVSGCTALNSVTLPPQIDFAALTIREAIWKDENGAIFNTTADMVTDNLGRSSGTKTYYALLPAEGWHIYGPCQWMIDENDNLIIKPLAEFEAATLPAWETNAPWYGEIYRTVSFEGSITATTCKNMFFESALTSADLSNLVISSETDLTDMFLGCDTLTTLLLPAGADLRAGGLAEYTQSLWADSGNEVYATTEDMLAANAARTSGAETYKTVALTDDTWTRCGACEWKIDSSGLMTVQPIPGLNDDLPAKLEDWGETSPWMNNATIKIAKFEKGVAARTCSHMFAGCKGLTFNDGMVRLSYIQNLDTSEVTDMTSMFEGCTSLATFGMSYLNISQVTTMDSMFKGCTSLGTVSFSAKATWQVTDVDSMFAGCSALGYVNLSSFDFSVITTLEGMFSGSSALNRLVLPAGADLSSANVREAGWKIRNVDTAYVTTAEMLAANQARTADAVEYDVLEATEGWTACGTAEWRITDDGELEIRPMDTLTVGILAEWTTPPWAAYTEEIEGFSVEACTVQARTCANMFKDCAYLVAANFTRFDISQATSLQNMFKGCTHLQTLMLAGFNTANVTNMSGMFAGCKRLTTITVSDEFVTANVTASENMFMGCSNLVGQNGTPYGSSHVNKTYARIDTADAKGYFTNEPHYFKKTEEVPATYQSSGTKAYWTCSYCGKSYSDETGLNRITDLDAWKAEGGEGYLAPLVPITVAEATAQVDDAFVGMKGPEGSQNLYKVTANVTYLAEGYVPMVGNTAMVKAGSTYVALVDQATAQAVSEGMLSISASEGTVESVAEVAGDVNMNGALNIVDVQVAYDLACGHYALGGTISMAQILSADVTADGVLTANDALAIQHAIFQ